MATPASNAPRPHDSGGDPGAPAHAAVRASGEVVAVTERDDFLLELGEALGGHVSLRPVDTVAAALEHLSGSRLPQLLALDTRGLADARADVDRAHAQCPQVPIVVFALSETERSVAGALKGSNVFAVLPIPVDRRKTSAILEGGLADAASRRTGARAAPSSAGEQRDLKAPLVLEPAAPLQSFSVEGLGSGSGSSRRGSPVVWIAAAIGAVALAGGVAWYFLAGGKTAPAPGASTSLPAAAGAPAAAATSSPAEAAQATAAVPLAQGTVDELLEKARLAMRERRYTEPASNCALLYYRSALGVDAANGEARDGMARLASLLTSRFDEALAAAHYDEAAQAFAGLKVAAPQDPRLSIRQAQLLRAEWNNALVSGNTDRAAAVVHQAEQAGGVSASELAKWRAELARHQAEARAQHLAELLGQKIREGHLLDPSTDSAKSYLLELEQIAAQSSITQRAARDFLAACLRKARDAAVAGHSAESDRWVAEARSAGMTAADFASYQHDLAAARQRAAAAESDRLAQLARARIQDGHLTDPPEDSAVHYLDQLKSYGGGTPADSIGRELAARLVEQAARSARAGQISQMRSELALAQRWGADPALVQAVQQIVSGRGTATQANSQAGQIPPGFTPKRTRYEEPDYPQAALEQRISGSVTIGFTLDTAGRPRDVRVIESSPPKVFDRAALNAVSRWRYEPVISSNNVPVKMPLRIVVRFAAPKD